MSGTKKCEAIAAFFDLDGTLTPLPSLEQRFIRTLRYRREISAKNYLSWLKEAVRLMPRGIDTVVQANKMYLKGVKSFAESDGENRGDSSGHTNGHQAEGQASAHSSLVPPRNARHNPRLPVPHFFAEGVKRVAWHAKRGHAIVLVSGTLEPLASAAAFALVLRLAVSGVTSSIGVCATRLEEAEGMWTGRVVGEAMFGEAKERAVETCAEEMQLDLSQCYAYGNSANDRWLLAAVGKPAAVNPSRKLARIAREQGWPVLHWGDGKNRIHESASRSQSPADQETLRQAERWI
jgi:phosphoserine phosphatase